MNNSNTKTWILMLALGLGGAWQISRAVSEPEVLNRKTVVADDDIEPYSARVTPSRSSPPPARLRSAAAPNVEAPTDKQLAQFIAGAGTTTETKDVAPKKTEDKCEPKLDRVTGKVIPCVAAKKKKKKKKTEVATAPAPANTLPRASSDPRDQDARGLEWNVGAAIQTGRVNAANTKPEQAYATLDQWEARLLGSPNLTETKAFIDQYQRNLVTSEVFYKITQKMLDDSRADMKLLGVMCAGVTSSTTSFQILAQFVAKQPTGTAPRTQADQALNRYTDLSSLGILASLLRANSNESATLQAAQKLDVSAKRYLVSTPATTATTPSTTTPPTTPAATTTSTAPKNRAQFTRFVAILTTLTKTSDPQVRDQATRSLNSLNSLLGPDPTAPVTPPNTPAPTPTPA